MIKKVIDAQTGTIQLVECEDPIYTVVEEIIEPPTEEERIAALEAALLELLGGM